MTKTEILNEVIDMKNKIEYAQMEELLLTLPYDADRELVKKTCETFTRLLLSLTPYKAKEFVERNCAKVTRKIMGDVNEKTISKYTKGGYKDE